MLDHSQSVLEFKVVFDIVDQNRVAWSVEVPKALQRNFNFIELIFLSPNDEAIYGMGLQYTQWNFKGVTGIPLVTAEAGVGRGLQPISEFKGIDAGTEHTSYAAAATFISNKQRGFICTNTNFGLASFT